MIGRMHPARTPNETEGRELDAYDECDSLVIDANSSMYFNLSVQKSSFVSVLEWHGLRASIQA